MNFDACNDILGFTAGDNGLYKNIGGFLYTLTEEKAKTVMYVNLPQVSRNEKQMITAYLKEATMRHARIRFVKDGVKICFNSAIDDACEYILQFTKQFSAFLSTAGVEFSNPELDIIFNNTMYVFSPVAKPIEAANDEDDAVEDDLAYISATDEAETVCDNADTACNNNVHEIETAFSDSEGVDEENDTATDEAEAADSVTDEADTDTDEVEAADSVTYEADTATDEAEAAVSGCKIKRFLSKVSTQIYVILAYVVLSLLFALLCFKMPKLAAATGYLMGLIPALIMLKRGCSNTRIFLSITVSTLISLAVTTLYVFLIMFLSQQEIYSVYDYILQSLNPSYCLFNMALAFLLALFAVYSVLPAKRKKKLEDDDFK